MEFRWKSPPAQALKSLALKDDFIERFKAEGPAQARVAEAFAKARTEKIAEDAAEFLLRLLARRDLTVSAPAPRAGAGLRRP